MHKSIRAHNVGFMTESVKIKEAIQSPADNARYDAMERDGYYSNAEREEPIINQPLPETDEETYWAMNAVATASRDIYRELKNILENGRPSRNARTYMELYKEALDEFYALLGKRNN